MQALSKLSSQGDDTIPVYAGWLGSWQFSLRRRVLGRAQLSHVYDRASATWADKLAGLGVPWAYEAVLRDVLSGQERCFFGAHTHVLDCGVGTGALSVALSRVAGASFFLDAVDLSPAMLETAKAVFEAEGINVRLRQADIRALPYPDDHFDLVMAGHVLEHLPDDGQALAELVRVLKPGGCLVVCLTRRSLLGAYVQLKWRTHLYSRKDAEGWLSQNGLSGVRCSRVRDGTWFKQLSIVCMGRKPRGTEKP